MTGTKQQAWERLEHVTKSLGQLDDERAVEALLGLIHTDIVDTSGNPPVGALLGRYADKRDALSSGERLIVEMAESVWYSRNSLGGLDQENRIEVLAVMIARYL